MEVVTETLAELKERHKEKKFFNRNNKTAPGRQKNPESITKKSSLNVSKMLKRVTHSHHLKFPLKA